MKILWITNIAFAHHRKLLGLDPNVVTGGTWLTAAYEGSLNNSDIQLHIATSGNVPKRLEGEKDGNKFYILPGGGTLGYDILSSANTSQWQQLREIVQPDAVIVWGTENRFAYLAMKIMKGLPMAIYMQGVIGSIYGHYFEGVPHKYQCKTLRDYIDRYNKSSKINNFKGQVILEREMFSMATAVIVENDWCEDMCRNVNPNLKVYRNLLPIREIFFSKDWSLDLMERQSIFVNAGGYPIKGHHILFQALGIVKQQFPDFKCYIPGEKITTFRGIKRTTGYFQFLEKLIVDNNLQDNIIYTGRLSSEQMAEHLATCNVYVMPSIMENHSSSLIEAMIVGAPSVTSLVGGTASLVKHKKNAIICNSLDYESIAGNIIRIFKDDVLAQTLSRNALQMRQVRKTDFGAEMVSIYNELIK